MKLGYSGGLGHFAVLRTLPFGSLNRRICGSFRVQISQSETSHMPGMLGDIGRQIKKRR